MALVTKNFSDIITFTRASTGTFFNSAGVLTSAAINAPRFDYNPVTLAAQGLLIEEARTNLLLQSEDLSTIWGLGDGTVTANSWTPPTGVATGDTYTIGTSSVNPSQSITVANSTTYAFSFYYNRTLTTAAFFRLRFGLASGSTSAWINVANAAFGSVGAQLSGGVVTNIGNNIYRVSLQIAYGASDGGSRSIAIAGVTADLGTTADTGNNLAIWGFQLEAGAFPTSYIPTTTTALTRSADVASVNTLSPWFNSTTGTIYAEFLRNTTPAASTFPQFVNIDDGSVNNRLALFTNSSRSLSAQVAIGGVFTSLTTGQTWAEGTASKLALAYQALNHAASANGSSPVTNTAVNVPSGLTTMRLGDQFGGSGNVNGYLRRITYYPRRLGNIELQVLTAPIGSTTSIQPYSLDTDFIGNTVSIGA